MTEQKKEAKKENLGDSFGLYAVIAILAAITYQKLTLALSHYYHRLWYHHFWGCIFVLVATLLSMFALFGAFIWNWFVDREYKEGVIGPEKNAAYLGRSEKGTPTYLKQNFRTMHMQVIGATCSGKSESTILPLSIHDVESGCGLLIIDGKADTSFLDKLYAYTVKAGREKDFRLFSLAHVDLSHSFNPLLGGGPTEIVERVFSSFKIENEYYRNIQYKIFLLLVRLIVLKEETPTFFLVHRLLTDMNLLTNWITNVSDEALKYELLKFIEQNQNARLEKTSGLETYLSHFAQGEFAALFNPTKPHIQFDEALAKGHICYFQLPSMYLPFLAEATGKLVLQCFQNAVSKRHLGKTGKTDTQSIDPFFSCFLDDFQDYIYEGFGSLLNKSRSANIGVVFSHQAIGDLNKVSQAFTNVVLTNTNIKCVMRTSDPETAEYFSRSFGTVKADKVTERQQKNLIWKNKTGEGSVREVDQYIVHPNEIRGQGLGHGVVSIPHPKGVKILRVAFQKREDLPPVPLPIVTKEWPSNSVKPSTTEPDQI